MIENDDGFLTGSSRVSPWDAEGIAEAQGSDKPIGTLSDLLHALCELSARHAVTWEIFHDHSNGIMGLIQYGVPDDAVCSTFDGLGAMLEGMSDIDGMFPEDFDEPFG